MNKISIVDYESDMAIDLWKVFFTAIRIACKKDYTQAQLEAWAPDAFDMGVFQEKMKLLNPFVAKIDSKIVGYADLQPSGLIDHFFVHGEYQAMGIGRALMQSILQKGAGRPKLFSNVSHTAKPFFQKSGFVVERIQDVQLRGCTLQNNLMVRFYSSHFSRRG